MKHIRVMQNIVYSYSGPEVRPLTPMQQKTVDLAYELQGRSNACIQITEPNRKERWERIVLLLEEVQVMEMQKLEVVGWRLKWYMDFTEDSLRDLYALMELLKTGGPADVIEEASAGSSNIPSEPTEPV